MDFFLLLLPFAGWLAGEVIWRLGRAEGVTAGRLVLLQTACFVPAVLGAKAFSLFERGWQWSGLEQELAGGWRFPGGLIGLVVSVPILQRAILPRLTLIRYADLLSVGVAFAGGVMRAGCFLNGCCTGEVCSRWYCVSYRAGTETWRLQVGEGAIASWARESLPVLPLHFLFMAASFAVGLALLRVDRRRAYDGQVFLMFLVLHEGAKFLLEFLRYPRAEAVQGASLAGAIAGAVGLAVVAASRRAIDKTSDG